jgi:hypothetical protein
VNQPHSTIDDIEPGRPRVNSPLMRGSFLIYLTLALAPAAGVAAEVPRTVQLEYERQEGAVHCPDAAAVRTGVAARLGYDPFREKADDHLRATIRQTGRVLEARIELADAQGNVRARRRLVSRNHDCAELASSVELAVAIAIDPMVSARRPEGVPPSSVEVADSKQTDVVPAADVAAPSVAPTPGDAAQRAIATRLELGLLGGMGFAPALNLGVRVGAALQVDFVSLGLELRADLPAAQAAGSGQITAGLLVASLVPCAHVGMASGCFLVSGGVQRVAGEDLNNARRVTLPYLGLGVRLGLTIPLSARMSLALHGDMMAPITETRLTVDTAVAWTSPTVAAALGAGLAMRFP